MSSEKITYANLSAESESLHASLDAGIAKVRSHIAANVPAEAGAKDGVFESRSPIDTRILLARVTATTLPGVAKAVATAKASFPAWRNRPWQERADILTRAAEIVRSRSFELAAWLVFENGKNRLEALGEIEETADLYEYYAEQMRKHKGFVEPMAALSPADTNTSVMRPYGVWAVIAPYNFPYALLGAPIAAALVAGNAVVAKASEETPIAGQKIAEIFYEAGVPRDVFHLVEGDRNVGAALSSDPGIDGITFTGSYNVGFSLYRAFSSEYPRPAIVEMGGKNAAIIMDSADLDRAVGGVYRSAFGMSGQKCSSCSRVFVHESVRAAFVEKLAARAKDAVIGDPTERKTFLGPIGTRAGFEAYKKHVASARAGGTIVTGGEVVDAGALAHGYFVRPTIVTGLPKDHELLKNELFVPLVAVESVASFDDAIARANDTKLGLTAGFFSGKQAEVDAFLDRIEAGVVYVNREAGATTGAWPGVQPFGGWKGSGSTGRNIGGLYSLTCYLREQSRTLTR